MGVAKKLVEVARTMEGGQFGEFVKECRQLKKFTKEQFHLKELAQAAFGESWEAPMRRVSSQRAWVKEAATGSTDVSAFRDVIASMTIAEVETGYEEATSIIGDLFDTWETPDAPTGTKDIFERFSATGQVKSVAPGTEYGRSNFQGLKVTAPEPVKHGLIGVLTLEAVKENDSKGFLKDSLDVGRQVGDYVNDLRIRVLTGLTNNYVQNGTAYNTYLGSGAWINQLDDWDISTGPVAFDRANRLFSQLVHPITGRSIRVTPTAVLAMPAQHFQIRSIAKATEVRVTSGSTTTVGANPLDDINPIKDQEVRRLFLAESGLTATQVDTHVWYGDFKRAFWERVVEPFNVFETADETDIAFFQDVVYAVKGRYWGVPFARNPRYVQRLRKNS